MTPTWVTIGGVLLGVGRFLCYLFLGATPGSDAQWQLSYLYLWIADLPVSVLYWFIPAPIGEAAIGPVWWFFLPRIGWWFWSRRSRGAAKKTDDHDC